MGLLMSVSGLAQKQYPSLLWEISGNGLTRPSYLFGTMHVSQKVAFHLGEPWYKGVESVDVVAMELNPETWLKELLNSDLLSSSFDMAAEMAAGKINDLDKERYTIGKDRPAMVVTALRDDPDVINSIMYRYSSGQGDYEEDSWLDMYIYQTGKKLGKQAVGLESFEESMASMKKASLPDEEEDDDESDYYSKYTKQADISSQIEAAYRNGNLDLLDSLSKKSSGKNYQKYLIVERNARFVNRMDSIMRKQALFTGVGAAHLPGEEGVINMLRKKGYTVTPVTMGERDADRRNKLDSAMVDVPFKRYVSQDSIISFDVPGEMQELYSIGMIKSEVGTELINGAYYSLSRIKTYSSLVDGNTDVTWKMVDSLLYDNIPGKIIEQKETSVNGYKALDILSRSRKGNSIRIRVILLPEELVVMKVSAPEERVKSFLGDRFFSSVTINQQAGEGWQRFTLPDKRMSVQLPAKPVFYGLSKLATLFSKTDLVAHDAKNQNDYIAMVIKQAEMDYFEEDTFELSRMARILADANNYTEKKRTLITFKDRKALKVQFKVDDKRSVDALLVMQGLNYYVFAAYYNKATPDLNKFFESIEFGIPEYKEFYTLVDSSLYFTTRTTNKPKSDVAKSMLGMVFGGKKEKVNKDEVIYDAKSYTDAEGKESVHVSLFKYSKYYRFKDEATFIKTAKYYITNYNDFEIREEKLNRNTNGLQLDFLMTDTNSSKLQRCRIILRNSAKYVLTATIDPQIGQSAFIKTFFEEFKPVDSITGGNLFEDKSDLFFDDLNSGDTARIKFARRNLTDLKFNNDKQTELIKLFGRLPAMEDAADFKRNLYGNFKSMPGKEVIEFLKTEYDKAGDTADYQNVILWTLAGMKTSEAAAAFKSLILKEPPLGGSSNYNLFYQFEDSAELAAGFFPDVFQLLGFDEYKDQIYSLLSEGVAKGKISTDVYKDKLNMILNEAKNQLKRVLSKVDEEEDYSGFQYSNRLQMYDVLLLPYIKQENVKAHFDKVLNSDNKSIKVDLLKDMLRLKLAPPVSLIEELAKDDDYRDRVYNLLKKENKEALFPAAQKNTELFVKSLMIDCYYGINKDSIFMLEKRRMEWRNKKGFAYFYKYKSKSAKGENYNLAVVGVIPEEPTRIITDFDFSSASYGNNLDKDEKLDKQLNNLLYETLGSYRRNNYYNQDLIDFEEQEYNYLYSESYD